MELSPNESAYYARLKDDEKQDFLVRLSGMTVKERTKYSVVWGALMAMEAARRGEEHPQRLTTERKAKLKKQRRLVRVVRETASMPRLPTIFVSKPVKEYVWGDFTDRRRGRYGAEMQE